MPSFFGGEGEAGSREAGASPLGRFLAFRLVEMSDDPEEVSGLAQLLLRGADARAQPREADRRGRGTVAHATEARPPP